LRGADYCAHPIEDRILIDPNRFIPTIEQGRHSFSLRLSYDKKAQLENKAQEFVNTPFSLNFFPHGGGDTAKNVLQIGNPAICLSAFYETEAGYILRLVNNNAEKIATAITLQGKKYDVAFTPYEVKTFTFADGELTEKAQWV
jgi:alpha-mannosidase